MAVLTQALMDQMAAVVQQVLPARWESVTYRSRVTASGTTTDHAGLSVAFETYSEHVIAMQALVASDRSSVQREDRRMRIASADVAWTPTLFDEVLRADGSHWRVLSVSGGPGHPFWLLQGRRLPPTS